MKKIICYFILMTGALAFSSCLKEDINTSLGTANTFASIQVVRATFKTAEVKLGPKVLSGAYLTGGIVVSDASTNNIPKGYVIIQSNWRGLVRGVALALDETSAAGFDIGDSIVVDIDGATLSRASGALTIKDLTSSDVTKVSENNSVINRPVAISELIKNFDKYENTLVSVTADVNPFPVNETFSGTKALNDGSATPVALFTESAASFAAQNIAPSATFVGIPYFSADLTPQLRMRSANDMVNPSGPIYVGYPEDFDSPDQSVKNTYAAKNIDLRTGNWRLEQCLLGNTSGRDRIVSGAQAIRFQQNLTASTPAYLQMNYDLLNGATKVTFWYGCYYTDAASSFQLEYSTNEGVSWTKIGETITDPLPTSAGLAPKQATFTMDIKGKVRFRINKLSLGATSIPTVYNGRLGIDDFAIYQGY